MIDQVLALGIAGCVGFLLGAGVMYIHHRRIVYHLMMDQLSLLRKMERQLRDKIREDEAIHIDQ